MRQNIMRLQIAMPVIVILSINMNYQTVCNMMSLTLRRDHVQHQQHRITREDIS